MYNIISGGYAEHVPGDASRLEKVRKENERMAEHARSLTLAFSVCEITGVTGTCGGYPETHPPISANDVAAMMTELNETRQRVLGGLSTREFSAEIFAFHSS